MRKDSWQRSRKSEAIRQHIFCAGFSKFVTEPLIAVQNLPKDCLSARRVHITLFHGRARWEPSTLIYIVLQLSEISGEILLHQPVAVGSAEVEDVVRVLFKQT